MILVFALSTLGNKLWEQYAKKINSASYKGLQWDILSYFVQIEYNFVIILYWQRWWCPRLFLKIDNKLWNETILRWCLRLFRLVHLPWDFLLCLFFEKLDCRSSRHCTHLPLPTIWSFRHRGCAVCNFLFQASSRISCSISC